MGVSLRNFFGLVDDTQPYPTDSRTISDDQHREIMGALLLQCPEWKGPVTATHADVNLLSGQVAAGSKLMSGQGGVTVIYSYNDDTPPLGWTVETLDGNLRELIIGPAGSGGTTGGTMDPTNMTASVSIPWPSNTQGTSLTVAQMPSHSHTGSTNTTGNHTHDSGTGTSSGSGTARTNTASTFSEAQTGTAGNHSHSLNINSTGSGSSHSHSISGSSSSSATMTPRYARGILMKLAA